MNDIKNWFLLLGDKLLSERHMMKPRFAYNLFGLFAKSK